MIYIITLINKTSDYPKLLQLKICVRHNQKERAPEELCRVFSEITKQVCFPFKGDKLVISEELKNLEVVALRFGQPESTKMLKESNISRWSGMRKDIKHKYTTGTPCISSGKNLEKQLPLMEKIKLLVVTEPG